MTKCMVCENGEISFKPTSPSLILSGWLRSRNESEMTIWVEDYRLKSLRTMAQVESILGEIISQAQDAKDFIHLMNEIESKE